MDLTCSCNAIVVVFFLSDINLSVFFPLNPVIYRIGNVPNILHPRCKEQDDKMNLTHLPPAPPHPFTPAHFTFYCKISKLELHKVCLAMGTSPQLHDSIHLKILPILFEMFLRHLSYCQRKACNEAYDKINGFSNFKYNPVSWFNKLQDTATELGSKDTFLGPGTRF